MSPVVFGAGLPRTGTTSLHLAMLMLGLPSVHRPLGMANGLYFRKFNSGWFEMYDAFTDLPISTYWRDLHESVPGSLVIATRRPIEDWLSSIEKFLSGTSPSSSKTIERDMLRLASFGSIVFSARKFTDVYEQHYSAIEQYSKSHPDKILVIDVSKGVDIRNLASFLSLEQALVEGLEFPHAVTPRIGDLSSVDRHRIDGVRERLIRELGLLPDQPDFRATQ